MSAIESLPLYSSSSSVFVIVAPTTRHADTGAICDIDTYSERMWCRAEQLCFWLRNGENAMYMASGEDGTGAGEWRFAIRSSSVAAPHQPIRCRT